MSGDNKASKPNLRQESVKPGRVNESLEHLVNRRPTIGDQHVRWQDGFVTRNAAPPPVSDIPARPKGK